MLDGDFVKSLVVGALIAFSLTEQTSTIAVVRQTGSPHCLLQSL